MKIAVCSLHIGERYKVTTKLGRDSKIKYCDKHNYDYIEDESVYDNTRPIQWSKILLLIKYLQKYDYLVWIDADTMIMNSDITLESIINTYSNGKDFLACLDNGIVINTGVFFIKNTEYALSILKLIYTQTDFIYHKYWEQGAFIYLHSNNINNLINNTTILSPNMQYIFNCSIYKYKAGYFLIHFLGISNLDHLEKVMEDFYPYKKENENDYMFEHRKSWLNNYNI
jgi:hypothetical protein|uniref:Nucleotide-diphospho-sugar transferase domain-containing protein n=1 Tax=viral metagenome TaxID=1070528 RepID=A0A6C0D1M5_9ZZZZ